LLVSLGVLFRAVERTAAQVDVLAGCAWALDEDGADAAAERRFAQPCRVLVEEVGNLPPAFEARRRVAAEVGIAGPT
jgi:predicted component of type VI protein secretion system